MEWLIIGGLIVLVWAVKNQPVPAQVAVQPLTRPMAQPPNGIYIMPAVAPPTLGSDVPLPIALTQQPNPVGPGQVTGVSQNSNPPLIYQNPSLIVPMAASPSPASLVGPGGVYYMPTAPAPVTAPITAPQLPAQKQTTLGSAIDTFNVM